MTSRNTLIDKRYIIIHVVDDGIAGKIILLMEVHVIEPVLILVDKDYSWYATLERLPFPLFGVDSIVPLTANEGRPVRTELNGIMSSILYLAFGDAVRS